VSFRVLPGGEVAGHWVPCSRFDLGTRGVRDPAGFPSSTLVRGRDSSDHPLMNFGPPSRHYPIASPRSRNRSTSRGVLCPYSARGGESPRPTRWCPKQASSRRLIGSLVGLGPGSAGKTHLADYGAAHRLSQPFSGFFPLSARPRFSRGWRSWGFPFRGLFLQRSPDDSSSPASPHDIAPAGCAAPVLGWSICGRATRVPRMIRLAPFVVFRVSVLVGISPHQRFTVSVSLTDLPLLGFLLLMV
jgi:hypothetical protein